MAIGAPVKTKLLSLGALRRHSKTKPRSPDLVGQLQITRDDFQQLLTQFDNNDSMPVECNIAAWIKVDAKAEQFLNVQLTPPFKRNREPPRPTDLTEFLNDGGVKKNP